MQRSPLIFVAVLGAMAMAISLGAAQASEKWSCTFPGWPDKKPVIVQFYISDGILKQNMFIFKGQPVMRDFTILQNNKISIVAAWSISEIEPDNTVPSIGAQLVIINKDDGKYLQTNADLADQQHDGDTVGQCVTNQ